MSAVTATRVQIAFDCADPHAQAAFWAAALGYEIPDQGGFVRSLLDAGRLAADEVVEIDGVLRFRDVAVAEGDGPRLLFQRVPEPKSAKNRVHLDLQVGAERAEAEVARLVALGATRLWETGDRGPRTFTLADPEGNELCVT